MSDYYITEFYSCQQAASRRSAELMLPLVIKWVRRLRENYRGQAGLVFENCAIGAVPGMATFYRVKAEYEPLVERSRQRSGFSPDVILKYYQPLMTNAERVVETISVPTLTLSQLLAKHGLTTLDLLQIDTEGHDCAVLQGLDFTSLKPAIIGYETAHLSHTERTRSYDLLLRNDYLIYEAGVDCIAYQRSERESAQGVRP